jgi:hypothetical protein
MNPLESFSVDTDGKASDGTWLCEVCGQRASVQVMDVIQDGVELSWMKYRPFGSHAFCYQHSRPSREYNEEMELVELSPLQEWTELPNPFQLEPLKEAAAALLSWRDREPML